MKHREKFSLLRLDSEQLRDAENKIELVSCPYGTKICDKQLSAINRSFVESRAFRKDKDFTRSVFALNDAFVETSELKDSKCAKCSNLFRATITESLEKIHDELQGMSTGLFKTKKYQASYILASEVLNDFKGERGIFRKNRFKIHEPLKEVV
jgi:hypothetical protein